MSFIYSDAFGVATSANQRTNAVAHLPPAYVRAAFFHDSSHFKTRNLPSWIGAVATLSLENITPVKASRPDPNKHLSGFGFWGGPFLHSKNGAIAGAGYTDCFH